MEPGSSDCQLRPELCEALPFVASPPPMCTGVSSVLVGEAEGCVLEEDPVEPLLLWGMLNASPLVAVLSWLVLASAEWLVQL